MTIPTPEQVSAALDAAPDEFRAYVALCAFSGLRLGEAAAIQAGDVDPAAHILRVRRQVQGQSETGTRSSCPRPEVSATYPSR